jgi:hypothetical protein
MDNGGELYGDDFEEFCKKCRITRKMNSPYTPKENGVVKIMNMTLMEKDKKYA